MVTVAVADLLGSACETAVTESDAGLGTVEGAKKRASLAVPRMVVEISPLTELPPPTPLTCQVTAVLEVPVTVAVNGWVASVAIVVKLGEMVTLTWAVHATEANPISSIAASVDGKGALPLIVDRYTNLLVIIMPPFRSFSRPHHLRNISNGFEMLRAIKHPLESESSQFGRGRQPAIDQHQGQ
jgi:hypothetical protein